MNYSTLQDRVKENTMAFGFGNNEQKPTNGPAAGAAINEEAEDFLNQFAGEGTEGITGQAVSTPWISIMQESTSHVLDGVCEAGVWRNSSSGTVYGKTLKVIPVAFKVIWNEKDPETGRTVQNYEPGSITPKMSPPRSGSRYPSMINPDNGNRIDETFLYAVTLVDAPQDGFCLLQAGMGSIGAFKRWNGQLRAQVLPNGARAPIFAYEWELTLSDKAFKGTKGAPYYRLQESKRGKMVTKQMFLEGVQPHRQLALTSAMALAAPSDEVEAERITE